MRAEEKEFVEQVLSTREDQVFAKASVQLGKVQCSAGTSFDQETLTKLAGYKKLAKAKDLGRLIAMARRLGEEIQQKSGCRKVDVSFDPGSKLGEVNVTYTLDPNSFLVHFVFETKRHALGVEFKHERRPIEGEQGWKAYLLRGAQFARYAFKSDWPNAHCCTFGKHWLNIWERVSAAVEVTYSRRWLDPNVLESCWTKQLKLIYDLNPPSNFFRENPSLLSPNNLYLKLRHKGRENFLDTDKASRELIKSSGYPDGLLSLKLGYKRSAIAPRFSWLFNSSLEFGYNKTDATFTKLGGYFQTYWNMFENNSLILYNRISTSAMTSLSEGDIHFNDALFLRGFKGLDDYPGAKTYNSPVVEAGKEHVGDRVGNKLVTLYQTKLYAPTLAPFSYFQGTFLSVLPYIFGNLGYAVPNVPHPNVVGWRDKLRASYGVGVTLLSSFAALDFFYSLGCLKPNSDLHQEFGFVLGFD